MKTPFNLHIKNQKIHFSEIEDFDIKLSIKREDQIHPFVSGNKYRKLKYNLEEAHKQNIDTILTFGGAHSNHIAATAFAGKTNNLKTIGIIRGEELIDKIPENETLKFAQENGMQFQFISRENYRIKHTTAFKEQLLEQFGNVYMLPEGGTNELAIKGCEDILTVHDTQEFDYVCCSVGTGGTISGLINCSQPSQQVLGFPALKGDFLNEDIRKFANKQNWKLISNYHFGGYAKVSEDLIDFINTFKKETQISLDPIYTGKMLFGIIDLIKQGFFPKQSKILAIHTGGLQGINGMNQRLKQKQLRLIH